MSSLTLSGPIATKRNDSRRNGGMSCMPIAKPWERFNADEPD